MSSVLQHSSFTLRAHMLVGGILPMANNETRNERLSQRPLVTWSRFIRMRVFHGVKKWPTYHVCVPTGNALVSQRSIFRKNCLKFDLYPLPRFISFVARINTCKVRCRRDIRIGMYFISCWTSMQRLFTPVPFILSSEPRMMVSGSLGVWVGGMVGILVNMNQ